MIEFYPEIKAVHVGAVIASGSLFAVRGSLMLARSSLANHAALRYLSYAIDTTLLTAALMLVTMLHQYPFVEGWLTAKVLLLVVYIVLGSLALQRARTRRGQVTSFFAALSIFLIIASIARAHHPLGIIHALVG
ncbi:MAG TPA: SirB2 family protein [Rhodanobacteraceae bacterium]|nr:SirB2 family protein [Rhodanobacteraceae bacterium]